MSRKRKNAEKEKNDEEEKKKSVLHIKGHIKGNIE
jgi:hypothetical protein